MAPARPHRLGPVDALAVARGLAGDLPGILVALHERHGPALQVGAGPARAVFLAGPGANEAILSTHATDLRWRDVFLPVLGLVDGDTALVVTDGPEHRRRRGLVQPAFHARRIEGYVSVMAEEAATLVEDLRAAGPGPVDLHEVARRRVRAIVVRCLFGDDVRAVAEQVADDLEIAIAYVNRPPFRRLDVAVPGTPYARARRAMARVDEAVLDLVTRRRASGDGGDDVLSWLLDARDEDGSALTDREVRDQVVSLVAAGYDTTSAAVSWGVWSVLATPGLVDELRAELDGVGPLTAAALRGLPLLDAVGHEVLRLHPPGPVGARYVPAEVEIAGWHVPRRARLVFSPFVSHRDAAHWPDPLRFAPGRWIEGHPDHHPVVPWSYIPFGGARRRCLGFAFADAELRVLLATLVRDLDLTLVSTAEPARTGIASMTPVGGVPVRVRAYGAA